jgi:hypothetical protein
MTKLFVVTEEKYDRYTEEMAVYVLGVACDKAGIEDILQQGYPGAVVIVKAYDIHVELPDEPRFKGWSVEVREFETENADTVYVVMEKHFDRDQDC